jgi:hypothetical protein
VQGGRGPLAPSPGLDSSPSPSCPLMFMPQHLTVASSCGETQPNITNRLRIGIDIWGEPFNQGLQSR